MTRLRRLLEARPWLAALPAALFVLTRVLVAPTERIAGEEFLDGMGTQWFYASIDWALRGRTGLLHTDMLFFPWGKELFLHTGGNLVDAVLAWPTRALFGPVLGYNLWILILLMLNAWGVARLASSFRVGPVGCGLAALLVTLSPFVLVELEQGRPTQALLVFLALGLVGLRERRPLVAGVSLALCGWTYWYLGLVAGLVAVLWLPLALLEPGRGRTLRTWGLAGLLTLVGVAPALGLMGPALEAGEVPGLLVYDGLGPANGLWLATEQGDRQALFVIDGLGRGGALSALEGQLQFSPGAWLVGPAQVVALGGLIAAWRRSGPLFVLLGVGWIVALGPTGVEPIWSLLLELDLLRRWWWPMRAMALVALALPVCAALLVQRLSGPWRLALAAGLVVPWSWGHAPLTSWEARHSPLVAQCLAEAPHGAVIDLPLVHDQGHLWEQVGHGKPQLGGMLSQKAAFGAGEAEQLLRDNAFAAALVAAGARQPLPRELDSSGREQLLELGYRYVLVRPEAYAYTSERGQRSDWPRVRRALVNLLDEQPLEDEESPRPVALWALDGGSLACE